MTRAVAMGKLKRLYENCRQNASDTVEFWEKSLDAFQRISEEANNHEVTVAAVEYFCMLQNEFCEALKGA